MTVALGLVCNDGVLVASDSMASSQMIATTSQKVRTLDVCPAIWTAAGSVYVMEEVESALKGFDKKDKQGNSPASFLTPDAATIRKTLTSHIHPAMKKAYGSALSTADFPPGTIAGNFATDFLFLGYANDKPWFIEFDQSGQINWHPEFYAIGSGGQFASVCRGLMAHYIGRGLTLHEGCQVAYRAIATTCEVSSTSVGLPVQIALVDSAGARILTAEELDEIGVAVDRWKELEADTLLMTSAAAKEESADDLPSMPEAVPAEGASQAQDGQGAATK